MSFNLELTENVIWFENSAGGAVACVSIRILRLLKIKT